MELLVALLTLVLGYFVGILQARQQRVIEEQTRVISDLFKRYAELEERVASLLVPYEPGGQPNKEEKNQLAVDSFNELWRYHRSNSIWLSRPTARYVDNFIERYRKTIQGFQGERGHPDDIKQWTSLWEEFEKESPKLREALEEEFRAVRGDMWAKLRSRRRRSELEPRP